MPLKSNRNFYFLFLILNPIFRIPADLASHLTLCHSALHSSCSGHVLPSTEGKHKPSMWFFCPLHRRVILLPRQCLPLCFEVWLLFTLQVLASPSGPPSFWSHTTETGHLMGLPIHPRGRSYNSIKVSLLLHSMTALSLFPGQISSNLCVCLLIVCRLDLIISSLEAENHVCFSHHYILSKLPRA